MTLEDTYPLPRPHKRRVSAYLSNPLSVKEQEKTKGSPNESEEGKDEDSTYPLPKKTG